MMTRADAAVTAQPCCRDRSSLALGVPAAVTGAG